MKDFLAHKDAKFDVRSAVDPTADQVREQLFESTQACDSDDHFLFYFSGHGRRGKNRKLYLCATDTDPERLSISGVPFDQVLEVIKESSLRSVLIILDCCYSGAAASSILIKSGDDLLDEQTKEEFTDGWTIITSTTSVETTEVYKQDTMSPFTREFIAACKRLQIVREEWITVAEVYQELRFKLVHQRPTLAGQNPIFRVCAGQSKRTKVSSQSGINLRMWDGTYCTFYGLLVMPYFRTWLLLNPERHNLDGATKLSDRVHAVYNHDDVFGARVQRAEQDIQTSLSLLEQLSIELGAPITLLFPIGVEQVTYRRFSGSDRKYIFHEKRTLRHRHYPVLTANTLHCITQEDSSWIILETPEDYMKEAFGVTLDYLRTGKGTVENSILILKEDSISRNAKYISVGRYTQQLINTSLINTGLEEKRTTISRLEGADERLDGVIYARRKRSIAIGSFSEVQTGRQKARQKDQTDVNCKKCMDERKVTIEVSTRRYSVPCPECNWQESGQWRPFYDHSPEDGAQPR